MGLPSIDITFKTLGMTAIQRSQKGIVAVILEDAAGAGAHIMVIPVAFKYLLAEGSISSNR